MTKDSYTFLMVLAGVMLAAPGCLSAEDLADSTGSIQSESENLVSATPTQDGLMNVFNAPNIRPYKYITWEPANFTSNQRKYPLVIYLHGVVLTAKRNNDLVKLRTNGLGGFVEKGMINKKVVSKIVLMQPLIDIPPASSGKKRSKWEPTKIRTTINRMLRAKRYRNRIDKDRIYLVGMSHGGKGVYDVAKGLPHTFAAIVPCSALGGGVNDSTAQRLRNVSVWSFHGQIERKGKNAAKQSASSLKKVTRAKGVAPPKFSFLAGVGHTTHEYAFLGHGQAGRPHRPPHPGTAIWRWLLKQKRPENPLPVK